MDYALGLRYGTLPKTSFPKVITDNISRSSCNLMISSRLILPKPISHYNFSASSLISSCNILYDSSASSRDILGTNCKGNNDYHYYYNNNKSSISTPVLVARAHAHAHQGGSTPENNKAGSTSRSSTCTVAAAGATFALACFLGIAVVCGGGSFLSPRKAISAALVVPRFRSASSRYQPPPISSQPSAISPTLALKTFLNMMVYLASPKSNFPADTGLSLREDIARHKKTALSQIKKGKNVDDVLTGFKNNCTSALNDKGEGSYNVGLAIIEILISQGKYREANTACNNLEENPIISTDNRLVLYKAIISTMLDEKNEAETYWKQFFEAEALPNPAQDTFKSK